MSSKILAEIERLESLPFNKLSDKEKRMLISANQMKKKIEQKKKEIQKVETKVSPPKVSPAVTAVSKISESGVTPPVVVKTSKDVAQNTPPPLPKWKVVESSSVPPPLPAWKNKQVVKGPPTPVQLVTYPIIPGDAGPSGVSVNTSKNSDNDKNKTPKQKKKVYKKVETTIIVDLTPSTTPIPPVITPSRKGNEMPLELYMSKGDSQPISSILEIAQNKLSEFGKETKESKPSTDQVIPESKLLPDPIDLSPDVKMKDFARTIIDLVKDGKPVVKPLNSIILPFNKKVFSWSQTSNQYPFRRELYVELINSGISEAKIGLKYINCNGTNAGLLKRMSAKLTSDRQVPLVSPYLGDDGEHLYKHSLLPIQVSSDWDWDRKISWDHPALQFMNSKSDAGMAFLFDHKTFNKVPKVSDITMLELEYRNGDNIVPLSTTPKVILDHALYWARKVFQEIVKLSSSASDMMIRFQLLFTQYPELFTAILKRKEERILRSEFRDKVRPYAVYPLYLRILFKIALFPLEQGLIPFWDRERSQTSISAYGFSTFYGGGRRLIEWINYAKVDANYYLGKDDNDEIVHMYFKGISYGDDQLWVFIDYEGNMLILTPDVASMDMSTKRNNAYRIIKHVGRHVKMPPTNSKLLSFALLSGYKISLHLGENFRVEKLNSLVSGVNGTTFHNLNSSADIQSVLKKYFSNNNVYFKESDAKTNEGKSFIEALKDVFTIIQNELGFEFKDITFPSTFEEFLLENKGLVQYNGLSSINETGLNVPFLKQRVIVDEDGPYCIPYDINSLLLALMVPGCRGKHFTDTLKSRILGLYLTGLWYEPRYAEYCHKKYKQLSGVEVNEIVGVLEDEVDPEFKQKNSFIKELASELNWYTSDGLPSYYCVKDMYLLDYDEF